MTWYIYTNIYILVYIPVDTDNIYTSMVSIYIPVYIGIIYIGMNIGVVYILV